MGSNFLTAMNTTYTENGALTNAGSGSNLLDYFSMGSALRTRTISEKYDLFFNAFKEDKLLAMKVLFYSRDPRGGQGERQSFRDIFTKFSTANSGLATEVAHLIPEYGRWDDLIDIIWNSGSKQFSEFGKSIVKNQFVKDITSDSPSLLAKWLPSVNTSSAETRLKANWVREWIYSNPLSQRDYRKIVSRLRSKIKIVEQQMSANQWSEINYSAVPSQASRIYRNAFSNHDYTRYSQFLKDVAEGKAKINTSVTYPYEVVREYLGGYSLIKDKDETLEQIWKNLPDFTEGREENSIVVCDTSGSMYPHAITVSLSLAIYFAERNNGEFKNHFITFSEKPQLQKITGNTLRGKIANLVNADWGMNTDIEAVFKLILGRAKTKKLSNDDLPSKIYIISDMEFDRCVSNGNMTNFENMQTMFEEAGYALPEVVFWNVESRNNQTPITVDDKGVKLVSGSSPSIFKALMQDSSVSPLDFVKDVVNVDRYKAIEEAMSS